MEEGRAITGDKKMVDTRNAVSLQPRAGIAFTGLPRMPQCMGWILDDGSIFIYGFDGVHSICGFVGCSQAIEFLAYNFQLLERQAI